MGEFYSSTSHPQLGDVPPIVISTLANLPDTYHIFLDFLMGMDADIVFVLVHENAICVVEVKDERGMIHGDVQDLTWTCQENTGLFQEFSNPYRQVRRYSDAIKKFVGTHAGAIFNQNRRIRFDVYKMRVFSHTCFITWNRNSKVALD